MLLIPAFLGGLAGGLAGMLLNIPGLNNTITRYCNIIFQNSILDISTVNELYRRQIIKKEELISLYHQLGFDSTIAEQIIRTINPQLSPLDIIENRNRQLSNDKSNNDRLKIECENKLKELGYTFEDILILNKISEQIPSLQDIITMVRREAWDNTVIERDRLLQDIPEKYYEEAQKRGLSKEWAEKYWITSWERPSIGQYMQFYQRLFDHPNKNIQFTEQDYANAMLVLDIAPVDAERLKMIAYNPIERVDIRRMYQLGIYGEGEAAKQKLIRAYRECGYSPDNAANLADFTIQEYAEKDKELSKEQILKYYREGVFGKERDKIATEALKKLKYNTSEIDYMLDYEKMREIDNEEADKIDIIEKKYVNFEIKDRIELRAELTKVNLTFTQIDKHITRIENLREKQNTKLTKADIDKLFKLKVVDESTYKEYLRKLGYKSKDIDLFVQVNKKVDTQDQTFPSKQDIISWYAGGLIDEQKFIDKMSMLGFSREDIYYYSISAEKPIKALIEEFS